MAKKNITDSTSPTAPKRAPSARRAAKPAAAQPVATAAEMSTGTTFNDPRPTPDEIAQAAYQRYLSRGGGHGRDLEDWIEAERALRALKP